jgi:hypothetical protein
MGLITEDMLCEALSHLREVWRDERLAAVTVSPERMRNELAAVISKRYFDAEYQSSMAQDVPPADMKEDR